jgi:hypothetical protein
VKLIEKKELDAKIEEANRISSEAHKKTRTQNAKKKKQQEMDWDEWDDLQAEERAIKKARKKN